MLTLKVLRCSDVGPECDAEFRGESETEVLEQVAGHAEREHGMTEISDQQVEDIKAAIREA